MLKYQLRRDIPVMAETEILVVGGGPGGVSAAVMAARQGRQVTLAERCNAPGGMAYIGEITPFMSNHIAGTSLDHPLYTDWNRKIWQYSGLDQEKFNDDDMQNLPLSKEIAMLAAEELLNEAGVRCFYHCDFFDVVKNGEQLEAAIFLTKSGLLAIKARQIIDATGDGDVAAAAGCGFEFGNRDGYCQPMTLCFKLSGVERGKMPDRTEINRLYDKAKAADRISCPRENVLFFDGPEPDIIHFNTTRIILKSGIDALDLSAAEQEGRRQMIELIAFLKQDVSGFARARLHSVASRIGVRESRRIKGKLVQTLDDFKQAKKYADAIARVHYHVDIHNPAGSGTTIIRLPENEWYEISFRTLVPENCRNLLIGCRAISVDHELYSSSRIMPVVCSIGQAAGMGAAWALEHGTVVQDIDGCDVRKRLIAAGANLK